MGGYTKEERTHVRKNVYAFKITNDAGEFLIFYWHDFSRMLLDTNSSLGILHSTIKGLDFIDQYYGCKKFASENNFLFEEYGKNDWKNILNSIYKVL